MVLLQAQPTIQQISNQNQSMNKSGVKDLAKKSDSSSSVNPGDETKNRVKSDSASSAEKTGMEQQQPHEFSSVLRKKLSSADEQPKEQQSVRTRPVIAAMNKLQVKKIDSAEKTETDSGTNHEIENENSDFSGIDGLMEKNGVKPFSEPGKSAESNQRTSDRISKVPGEESGLNRNSGESSVSAGEDIRSGMEAALEEVEEGKGKKKDSRLDQHDSAAEAASFSNENRIVMEKGAGKPQDSVSAENSAVTSSFSDVSEKRTHGADDGVKVTVIDSREQSSDLQPSSESGNTEMENGEGKQNAGTSVRFIEVKESGAGRISSGGEQSSFNAFLKTQMEEGLKDSIVTQAKFLLKDGNSGEIRLILHPENLGKVRIKLDMQDNLIAGRILVDNNSVKEAIQQNLQSLLEAFEESGYETGSLDVSVGGEKGERGQQGDQSSGLTSGSLATEKFDKNSSIVTTEGTHQGVLNLMA